MKRLIIIGILALCTLSASAQSVKGLIEQYRHEKNVIHLHITPALMSFLKVLAKKPFGRFQGSESGVILSYTCL